MLKRNKPNKKLNKKGVNEQGNVWRNLGDGFHYSNVDRSYYYQNKDESTYYNDGKGYERYTRNLYVLVDAVLVLYFMSVIIMYFFYLTSINCCINLSSRRNERRNQNRSRVLRCPHRSVAPRSSYYYANTDGSYY